MFRYYTAYPHDIELRDSEFDCVLSRTLQFCENVFVRELRAELGGLGMSNHTIDSSIRRLEDIYLIILEYKKRKLSVVNNLALLYYENGSHIQNIVLDLEFFAKAYPEIAKYYTCIIGQWKKLMWLS